MAYESIYPKTPVGRIEVKQLPARTILAAEGTGDPFEKRNESFRKLFSYIQRNKVGMTVPVEADSTKNRMQFFVGSKDIRKDLKSDGQVTVRQLPPATVVSIGLRGAYTRKQYERGLKEIGTWLTKHPEWEAEGEPYAVYWNSPFVPPFLKKAEVHQPVRSANGENPARGGKEIGASPSIYHFMVKDINGRDVKLEAYRGKVLLIVNVASRCGFTPQYAGLQRLYDRYRDRGLVILGFPANNFLWQEPGTDQQIKSFCSLKYNVTFPVFSKISVKGRDQHPLYHYLTDKRTNPSFAGPVSWNFNKFIVDRQGRIINRFGSRTAPEDEKLINALELALRE